MAIAEHDQSAEASAEAVPVCGHVASGNGFVYVCDKRAGHTGWHEQRMQLRDGVERTNWGSDGLAMHASADRFKPGF
jgi:hypothetical protein